MGLFNQFAEYYRDFDKDEEYCEVYKDYEGYEECKKSPYDIFENEDFLAHLKGEVKFLSDDGLLNHADFFNNLIGIVTGYIGGINRIFEKRLRKKSHTDRDITILNSTISALKNLQEYLYDENFWGTIDSDDFSRMSEEISNLQDSIVERIEKLEHYKIEPLLLSDINKRFDNALGELLRDKTDLSVTDLAKDITALRKIFRKIFDNKPLKFFIPKD